MTAKRYSVKKADAQSQLDRMVFRYGLRAASKLVLGGMAALVPAGIPAAVNMPLVLAFLCIAVSGILFFLVLKWAAMFKGNCPRCGSELKVERRLWGISKTVVLCPECHLESKKFQDFEECGPP